MNKLYSEKLMLQKALKGGYSVGAFNFSSIEMMRAIVDACEEAKSPVILALSESGLKYADPGYIKDVINAVMKNTTIPIALHLDHGKNFEIVKKCIKLGFNSVMIDGSYLPYDENVKLTKKVVQYAHKYGVSVEGELGVLAGVEDDVKADEHKYTDPEQALDFVKKTGVDSLAIAIGTSHGAFKFKGEPTLKFDILKKVSTLMPNLPIVLHGASNVPQEYIEIINKNGGKIKGAKGVSENLIKKASKMAVCKVNNDTDLRVCFTAAIREYLKLHPEEFTPRKYLQYAKDKVKELILFKIKKVFGSANKA